MTQLDQPFAPGGMQPIQSGSSAGPGCTAPLFAVFGRLVARGRTPTPTLTPKYVIGLYRGNVDGGTDWQSDAAANPIAPGRGRRVGRAWPAPETRR